MNNTVYTIMDNVFLAGSILMYEGKTFTDIARVNTAIKYDACNNQLPNMVYIRKKVLTALVQGYLADKYSCNPEELITVTSPNNPHKNRTLAETRLAVHYYMDTYPEFYFYVLDEFVTYKILAGLDIADSLKKELADALVEWSRNHAKPIALEQSIDKIITKIKNRLLPDSKYWSTSSVDVNVRRTAAVYVIINLIKNIQYKNIDEILLAIDNMVI